MAAVITAIVVSLGPVGARDSVRDVATGRHVTVAGATYQTLAARSVRLLEGTFFNGSGLWHMCVPGHCNIKNRDWGADALTNVLYFRWATDHDRTVLPVVRALAQSAHLWTPGEHGSSDSVMWDAVADVRMYQVTGSDAALAKAEAAIRWLGSVPGLATGACPVIDYQWPYGHRGRLKTIETASNFIKAAVLLYQITGKQGFLLRAESQYARVRRYFFVPSAGLYTAYMFDSGSACPVLPGQYFASVNGNMIWAGQAIAAATGNTQYLSQALATARAVQAHLSDGAGVFADLQADNDITGPLVEAMYSLATTGHQAFAARWLMTSASAAGADDNSLGEFGRFFDGPPPGSLATSWQISGGIDVMAAAAALRSPRPSGRSDLLGARDLRGRQPQPARPGPAHRLHRPGDRDHGDDRRRLLHGRPREGLRGRRPDLQPGRNLAEHEQPVASSARPGAVRLALEGRRTPRHHDPPGAVRPRGRWHLLPDDRLPGGRLANLTAHRTRPATRRILSAGALCATSR